MFRRVSQQLCRAAVANSPLRAGQLASRYALPSLRTPIVPRNAAARNYSTPIGKIDKPTYHLSFTCKACSTRSGHLVSKQAYHKGTVLIQCPECKNRHLIADHLNVFGQGKKDLAQILKEKGDGETIKEGKIDIDKLGDLEWEDNDSAPQQLLDTK